MEVDRTIEAHGILGPLAWVIFFPAGAILIRVVHSRYSVWFHAAMQLFALMIFTSNFGMGVWIAKTIDYALSDFHPVIGILLFSLVWTQPPSGLVHHTLYKRNGGRTVVTYVHIWLGRLSITLGMIQGGLGLLYADQSTTGENVAYGVVAAVIWLTYIGVVVFETKRKAVAAENTKN